MNSEQRREARYQRRLAKRQAKIQQHSDDIGSLEDIFSYTNLFKSGCACTKGVRWKQSTQRFENHLLSGTAKRHLSVQTDAWQQTECATFTLCERGKVRPIHAPYIYDRQVHKVLSRNVLYPLYTPSMIYDNGASVKGKGLHFAFNRLRQHLRYHYKHFGREGCVVLIDFKSYFPSAKHCNIYARHDKYILNPRIKRLADAVIQAVPGDTGMWLGVEPSQLEMVSLPSPLDNYIKCQLRSHGAAHYMDDYYVLFPSRALAKECAEKIINFAENLGISVNRNKCHIIDLTKPFKFCKAKVYLTDTGKVVIHGNKYSVKLARRKFKMLHRKLSSNRISKEDANDTVTSQLSYFDNYNDHNRLLKLRRLWYTLNGGALCTD